MGTGHEPTRRCIGCGVRTTKDHLVRFVAVAVGHGYTLVRDDRARHPGRGLYVCPRRACFEVAVQRRAFPRAARLRGGDLVIDAGLEDALD